LRPHAVASPEPPSWRIRGDVGLTSPVCRRTETRRAAAGQCEIMITSPCYVHVVQAAVLFDSFSSTSLAYQPHARRSWTHHGRMGFATGTQCYSTHASEQGARPAAVVGHSPQRSRTCRRPNRHHFRTLRARGGGQSTADERDRRRHTGPGALQLCAARASRQHEGPCQRYTARRGRCQHSEHDPTARGKRRLQRQQSLVAAMIALVAKRRAPTRSLPRDVNVAAGWSCHVTRAC
jgi:hypothetical protein